MNLQTQSMHFLSRTRGCGDVIARLASTRHAPNPSSHTAAISEVGLHHLKTALAWAKVATPCFRLGAEGTSSTAAKHSHASCESVSPLTQSAFEAFRTCSCRAVVAMAPYTQRCCATQQLRNTATSTVSPPRMRCFILSPAPMASPSGSLTAKFNITEADRSSSHSEFISFPRCNH